MHLIIFIVENETYLISSGLSLRLVVDYAYSTSHFPLKSMNKSMRGFNLHFRCPKASQAETIDICLRYADLNLPNSVNLVKCPNLGAEIPPPVSDFFSSSSFSPRDFH